MRMPRTLTLN